MHIKKKKKKLSHGPNIFLLSCKYNMLPYGTLVFLVSKFLIGISLNFLFRDFVKLRRQLVKYFESVVKSQNQPMRKPYQFHNQVFQ